MTDTVTITQAMQMQQVSIRELARRTGLHPSTLHRRLTGQGRELGVEELRRITEALNLTT